MYTGPNLTNDDLVFGYDTGHGITNVNTATRFCPGQPTINLYTNSDFSNGGTGWTFGSWDGNISHAAATLVGPYGQIVSARKLTVNAASSYSHFHQYNNSKYVSGSTYTTTAWVKGNGVFQIKSHWGGNVSLTLTGEWQRIRQTVTATTSTTGNFPYLAGEGLTVGTDCYVTMCQTELKGHATPYVYSGATTGSRTSTQSLIDLKRTRNIDVANVSYDNAAQHVYDGSNDYIVSTALLVEGSQTFEAVFTPTANAHSPAAILTNHSYTSPVANFGINYIGGNKLGASIGYTDGTREYDSKQTSGAVWVNGSNIAVHAVLAYNATLNQIKWYINGELDATHSLSATPNFQSVPVCSGRWVHNYGDYYYDGQVHLGKIYKKELTASEIKSNFKAYKNRFNI
jgi:hypothetical protein